jgi:hypothetical protein
VTFFRVERDGRAVFSGEGLQPVNGRHVFLLAKWIEEGPALAIQPNRDAL